jgi:hypothetical protein
LNIGNPTISSYNPHNIPQNSILHNSIPINFSSIAKVCNTDSLSLEAIYTEILEQIKLHINKGCKILLNFKVGKLRVQNNEINWTISNVNFDAFSSSPSRLPSLNRQEDDNMTFKQSNFKVGSKNKKELSVMTPSLLFADKTKQTTTFHPSNPNP